MNPLNSIPAGIVVGVVLAIVVFVIMPGSGFNELSLARWLHILSGVMWVGLLFYVVVAQIPGLAAAAADKGGPGGAGITKYVAPRVLLWFRWGAVATWLTGAWYLVRSNNFVGAFTLGLGGESVNQYHLVIGTGAWLGTIMLFNVWVADLAESEEDLRCSARDRRTESRRAQDGELRNAHQLRTLDPAAALHGFGDPRPAVLSRRRRRYRSAPKNLATNQPRAGG